MSFEYDDPIIHMPRKGTQDSPFRDVEESLIIDNSGKVILNEYPNRFRRVIVTDDKGNNLYEVKSGTPDENGFFVDYSSKTITFNKAHIGKQFHFKYSGEGNSFIPVNSIYTERDGLKVTETLDQLTETTKQARDKANEQASYAKNQGNYAKEQGQKAQDVADNTRYVEPYNDKKLYHKNNIVTHNGNSYMAKKDTIGNEPTGYGDDEYWGLVGFRGQDGVGSVSVKKHTFIATEGQKVFKLPFSYEPLKNRTRVYVGGAPQNTPENYEETNENTITLTEGVRQGTTVYVEVFSTEFDDRIAEFDEKMSHMNNSLDELDGAIQDATTHSEYAKNQGDYAKTQGDYAKEKGEIAQDIADNLEYVEPYNTTKQYKKNNIVTFNGNSFIAKKVNIGNPPPTDLEIETENEYWGLVGRKGDDGTGTVHTIRDEFIATEGQTVFELSKTYDQFQNRTKVIIDGVPQRFPESYDETTPNTITLKEGVYEGAKVVVEYFSKSVPLESDIATTVYNHTNKLNEHESLLHHHSDELNSQAEELTDHFNRLNQNDLNIVNLQESINQISLKTNLAKLNSLYLGKFYKKMQNADSAPIGNDVTIACQGDSMTVGNGSSQGNSFPEQLKLQLQKIARPGQVINIITRGAGGDSTKQSLDRWTEPSGADLCIIYLGTNDFNKNILMEEFSSSYEAIIQKEIKNGTAVILVTPHKWRNANWMVKANNGSIGDYVAVIKDFGRQYNAPVFDLHAESRNLDYTAYANEQDPGIHFSDIGYKNLAVKLAAFLGFHHPLTLPKLKNGDFLGVRPSIDGIKEPSRYDPFWYSTSYPTPSEWNSEGIGIAVGEEERIIYYSFYAEEDNLALIPSFFFTASDGSEKFEMVINDNCMPYHPNNRYQYGSEIIRTLPPTSLSLKMSNFPSGNPVSTTTQNFFLNPRSYFYRYLPTKGWYVIQLRLKNIRLHGFDVLNMVQMTNYRNIYLMQNS